MIELTPEQLRFVEAQVAAGGYKDPADVVRAGIELLRKATEQDYRETVREIREVVPELEAGQGRTLEAVDESLREKFGFAKRS